MIYEERAFECDDDRFWRSLRCSVVGSFLLTLVLHPSLVWRPTAMEDSWMIHCEFGVVIPDRPGVPVTAAGHHRERLSPPSQIVTLGMRKIRALLLTLGLPAALASQQQATTSRAAELINLAREQIRANRADSALALLKLA